MNPALSVIVFTTASGAGYGLLALTGILSPFGLLPGTPWFGLVAILFALALASGGLIASTLHLGHPERAWRAVTQWRSSWLAREGLAALITYLPAFACIALWFEALRPDAAASAFGVLAAVSAIVTLCCTAMIYISLRPIRQWRNGFVMPNFLLLAGFSGALWLAVGARIFHSAAVIPSALALFFGIAAALCKLGYWRAIDQREGESTAETATGLGMLGRVRMLDPPHTEENYIMREMGFRIARKHARRLRGLALIAGFVVPLPATIAALAVGGAAGLGLAILAALCALAGIFIERWLFFAEATHTVVLYYGRAA